VKSEFTLGNPGSCAAILFALLTGDALPGYGDLTPGPSASFLNPDPIGIPAFGPAAPYPSPLSVSGVSGEITSVAVTLIQLSHAAPDDLDIALEGPGGQTVWLMSDAGGSNRVGNLTLTFTDASTLFVPDAGRFPSGAYRPTNYGSGDVLPAPAPAGPYGSLLALFNGTNPNGVWRLYVVDDTALNSGVLAGGWRLDLNTTNYPPVITKQPQDQTVRPGSTARFRVEVAGTPPFGFEWRRNHTEVVAPFGQGKDTLLLPDVQVNDAGVYSVIVTNAANPNGVRSADAILNVLGPLTIVDPPRSVETKPGAIVRFQVTAAGTPPLHYQWRQNGVWLKDETNATLTLTEVQPRSGGDFSVVVWNDDEAITTEPATLVVRAATGPPLTDFFQDRPTLRDIQGVLQGNSAQASAEPGEPIAPGGGKSVWLQWVAPAGGILHLTTRGTSFDTLLRVFAGSDLRDLKPVARDDDRAGFYTSVLDFNATAGQPYQIQLDGFGLGGVGGEFTLSWVLEITEEKVPIILVDPLRQAVRLGDKAVFEVQTEPTAPGVPPLTYQWFFNGNEIRGATSPTFAVEKALTEHVGFYSVLVRNQSGRFVISPVVDLQLGSRPGFFLHDKTEMMFLSLGGGQFVPIGVGASVFTQAPWPALAGPKDPNPCNSPFVGTLWQGLTATNSGRVQVVTTGSSILTRLAIYRLTGTTNDFGTNNPPMVCDVTSATNGQPCVATFDGQLGTNYTIVVEGYQAPTGTIQVTSVMGSAPPPTNAPRYCLVALGGGAQLDLPVTNWFPAPACQWQLNHSAIVDATNSTLLVTNFDLSKVGIYSVTISNFVSLVTNDVAYLALDGPFTLGYASLGSGGSAGFVVRASNAAPFVLETTTNLTGSWLPVATNPDPCLFLSFTNSGVLADPQRFFRAAPWSPP